MQAKTNLLGMDRGDLEGFFGSLGAPGYRAGQLLQWVHAREIIDFAAMTDFSKQLRQSLQDNCELAFPQMLNETVNADGSVNWTFQNSAGVEFNTLFVARKKYGTLYIATQTLAADQAVINLSAAEIIAQVWLARAQLRNVDSRYNTQITDILLLGVTDALLNLKAVNSVVSILRDQQAYALPRTRVTVFTTGIVPAIDQLTAANDVSLGLYLHAPSDLQRDQILARKNYPLAEVMAACKRHLAQNKRYFITIKYPLLKGVNDSVAHARQLIKLVANIPCKVMLIPHAGEEVVLDFANTLSDNDVETKICNTIFKLSAAQQE